jgi:integrase
MAKQYTLYKRKADKKEPYYVRFRDPETGKRMSGLSTHTNKKAEADNFAIKMIRENKVSGKSKQTFERFSDNFFNWKTSIYIKHQIERGGRYSKTYADSNAGILKNHVLPAFKGKYLAEIRVLDIEHFLDGLIRVKYSNTFINSVRNVLQAVFSEAYRLEILETNPMDRIYRMVADYQPKGIFNMNQIEHLFSRESIIQQWDNRLDFYLINILALTTGMRQGEIMALRICDVKEDHILISHTWDRKYGLKSPKYESSRPVPLPDLVNKLLHSYISHISTDNPEPNALIFQGALPNKPIDHKAINKSFYKALVTIGIDFKKRKDLNLTFHSWRHTFNTLMRHKVSDDTLKLLTGHKTNEMLEHYTHYDIEKIRGVIQVENNVFNNLAIPA